MKRLPALCTVMILCTYMTIANDAGSQQLKPKRPQLLRQAAAAKSCNVLYGDVASKLCFDWRGKHGLAALYDLLPTRTPVQRNFKKTVSASYQKAYGRIPEKMPLALPRFERLKVNYRVLLRQYNQLKQKSGQCPACPSQPIVTMPPVPVTPPEDQNLQLRQELNERAQQLNDSIAVATKSIAELSSQLSQKQTPDTEKHLGGAISNLSKQIESLTALLGQQKTGITETIQTGQDARKEIEEAKRACQAERDQLEESYKQKTQELTDQLVVTSKQLSEVTFLLQGKKGEPIISENELTRITDQLNLANNQLIKQRNETAKEQQFARNYQHTLDDLKSALSYYVLSDQRLMNAYNNYSEIFATQTSYTASSIKPIVDELKSKWNDYLSSINTVNAILHAIGIADVQIRPNECYTLKVKGALMGHDVELEEPLPDINESELMSAKE